MEKQYNFNQSETKLVEKIIDDDTAMINHMILNKGDHLPRHMSNSNVYMLVIRGTLSLQFNEEPRKNFEHGSIVNIPYGLQMNVSNEHDDQVEFFVVKAPNPRLYK
ncbi:MAG TPA: cupin domain-containing protein [Candidatus Dorea intestinavium]|nr:cupin domain-containing protein [Candidatus Dorea intestinavium]